jgi:small-conductance mechanosensitive channel
MLPERYHRSMPPLFRSFQTWSWRKSSRIPVGCASICLLVCGVAAGIQTAASHTPAATSAAPASTAPTSSAQVLSHLNLLLRWYRQWTGADVYLTRVGDEVYITNGRALAQQVVQLTFQSALTQAEMIGRATNANGSSASANAVQMQNLAQTQQQIGPEIADLQARLATLDRKIPAARIKDRSALLSQREILQSQMQLAHALQDNLQKLTSFMTTSENAAGAATELSGRILALERTVPAAQAATAAAGVKPSTVKAVVPTPVSASDSNQGLIGQVAQMFHLIGTLRSLDGLIDESAQLENSTQKMRTPLLAALRATLREGQIVMQTAQQAGAGASTTPSAKDGGASATSAPVSAPASAPGAQIAESPAQMTALVQQFKLLSNATLPLSQSLVLIEQSESNLIQLQSSIRHEYVTILQSVLIRVATILFSLGMIWLFSALWRRATFRYIRDARRRRQFLVLRRVITGFCMFVVIVLGFVSEFSSLATYAGLITAGVAVALQGIILSIAAYFFLVGRYGVRVGDRVTVVYSGAVSVSGEVLDIGLVRFSLMELSGTGIDMQPTGRIAVFPNSVLFQTTPLFKQLPGTEYTWRELAFPLHPDTDPKVAEAAMMAAVSDIYKKFCPVLERQYRAIEESVGVRMDVPKPYTRVRFIASGLEAVVRYPIPMRDAAAEDDSMVIEAREILRKNPAIRLMDGAMPELRSAIKS